MAFTPNQFLYNPTTTLLRDPQHAARVFTDDQFRLAPKHKFLFHVAFNINQNALANIDLVQRHRNEINVLVKACDLPNFSITTDTLNQYNRKKNVQITHKFNPINITFHDDNMGLINALWQNYYSYYFADPAAATSPGAYNRNATKSYDYIKSTYGLDNSSSAPFFNYITIYQMARHEYVSYKLINPIITSWNHNRVDYNSVGIHDNTVQIQYEAVSYSSGSVTQGDPEGFGLEHYDQTPSPLQPGKGDLASFSPSFSNQGQDVRKETLNTVIQQVSSYQNTKEKNSVGASGASTLIGQQTRTSSGGIPDINFPVATTPPSNIAVATQRKLT